MSFITIDDLHKSYGRGEARVWALSGVSLELEQGDFMAVMGPSGSGKSTLLSIMGGLNPPGRGSYLVDELDIYSLSSDQRADFRREYLGFVFQNFNLLPYLNLMENVMLPLAPKSMPAREKRSLARQALERVGLGDKVHRLPNAISGGEQERTAVARALVNEPPILLADEPTGNLDLATSNEVMRLFSRLNQEGMTIIMVTHSPECASYAKSILSMRDGVIEPDPQLGLLNCVHNPAWPGERAPDEVGMQMIK